MNSFLGSFFNSDSFFGGWVPSLTGNSTDSLMGNLDYLVQFFLAPGIASSVLFIQEGVVLLVQEGVVLLVQEGVVLLVQKGVVLLVQNGVV